MRVDPIGVLATVEEARRRLVGRLVSVAGQGQKGWLGKVREVTDGGEVRVDGVRGETLTPRLAVRLEEASRVLRLIVE